VAVSSIPGSNRSTDLNKIRMDKSAPVVVEATWMEAEAEPPDVRENTATEGMLCSHAAEGEGQWSNNSLFEG